MLSVTEGKVVAPQGCYRSGCAQEGTRAGPQARYSNACVPSRLRRNRMGTRSRPRRTPCSQSTAMESASSFGLHASAGRRVSLDRGVLRRGARTVRDLQPVSYDDRIQNSRVQPFFNAVGTLAERAVFVEPLEVTHMLVGPTYYDEMRSVLDNLPQQFRPKYSNGKRAV